MSLEVLVESTRRYEIQVLSSLGTEGRSDLVAVEAPLELRVNGRPLAVIMRTPGHDLELGAGFLVSESILERPEELATLTHCPGAEAEASGHVLDATLDPSLGSARLGRLAERATQVSASCGVCGRKTLEQVRSRVPPFEGSGPSYAAELIGELTQRLSETQAGFHATGGLHGAAVFTSAGELLVTREDVGRHNAVDKCVGALLLAERWPPPESLLVVSGRAGFEIVEKALIAGLRTVVSISAPSSLAVELARSARMNLYAFVRGGGLNVYAGRAPSRSRPG